MKTWIGQRPSKIKAFQTKREAVAEDLINPTRIDFGLYGLAWVQLDSDGLLLRDGRKAVVHSCHPHGGPEIVGLRDRETVYDGHKYRSAWLESFDRSVSEKLAARAA